MMGEETRSRLLGAVSCRGEAQVHREKLYDRRTRDVPAAGGEGRSISSARANNSS